MLNLKPQTIKKIYNNKKINKDKVQNIKWALIRVYTKLIAGEYLSHKVKENVKLASNILLIYIRKGIS